MNWETLISYGDSITIGSRTYLGYPEIAGAILKENTAKNWNVINVSVAGFTTIQLERLVAERMGHLRIEQPSVSTLMIGTNDAKAATPESDFRIAYEQLLLKIRLVQKTRHVICIGIPHFQEGVMLPYELEMNSRITGYNEIIKSLSEENNLRYFEMIGEKGLFFDGVHLNEKGVHQFGKQLAGFILKIRGVEI